MNKTVKNLIYMLKPIWKVSPAYVIINFIYTFENIPQRLLNLFIIKYIVEAAINGKNFKDIVIIGITFLAIEILLTVLKHCFTQLYKIPKEEKIRSKIKFELFKKIKQFDIANYDNTEFYDKYTLAFSAAENTSFEVFNNMIRFLSAIISATTYLSFIMYLSPLLIVSALIGSMISLTSSFILNRYSIKHQKERVIYERKIGYINGIYSSKQNAADIRMGIIPDMLDDFFNTTYEKKILLAKKYGNKYSILNIVFESPLNISDMFMWLYIAYGIITGFLKAGDFMALSNATWALSQQLRNIFNILPAFHKLSMQIENILVLDTYETSLKSIDNKTVNKNNEIDITMKNVCFTYSANSEQKNDILNNISFSMKSKEKVAIVGHNGAGKSTIVKLLLRLYDPTHGLLLLNEQNYNTYNIDYLRSIFSVVFQDYQHYSFTIAENILLRKIENEQDVELVNFALHKVGLFDKISNMPLGINTQLTKNFDNDGILLSGGELQKLAIARALVQNTPVVIMDEPSSALDPLSEREIANLLTELFKDKLVLIISHRLSLTKNCDQIVVIDNGIILEAGKHEDLVAINGKYAELWNAQAEHYKE